MENQANQKQHSECEQDKTAHKLVEEGRRLQKEGHRLEEEARRLVEQGKRIEAEGQMIEQECEEKQKDLIMFVNRIRFNEAQGVKREMEIDQIAGLVGLTAATAIVRRLLCDDDTSDPLFERQKIKRGDQFTVTRKKVEGGFRDRVESEIMILREATQSVEYHQTPFPCVIYRGLSTGVRGEKVDVVVPVPNGYPSAMIDRAGLPNSSNLVGKVKGSPQEIVQIAGVEWRMVSYHPHAGGGGDAWNPAAHGFHTYLSEVLAWLEARQ